MEVNLKKLGIIYKNLYFVFFILIALFGRSFTGVYILGFRIGELMIAACMLLSIFFNIRKKKQPVFLFW